MLITQANKWDMTRSVDFKINVSNIERYLDIGKADRDWYKDTEMVLVDLFGSDRLKLTANLFAATSIASSLKSNIALFRKALHEMETGKPFSNYLPNIKIQLERIRRGEELSGRKIRSFASAMSGDRNAVVVDRWLLRAFDIDKQYTRYSGPHAGRTLSGGASDRQYTVIENFVREIAADDGYEPREYSAMIWSGVRISKSGDRTTRYTDLLRSKIISPLFANI